MSQPRSGTPNAATIDYVYESVAGRGITVYVIDSGLNMQHGEIARSNAASGNTYRWLWPEGHVWDRSAEIDTEDHGTCVTSKISGWTVGVAKLVTIVVVPLVEDRNGDIPYSAFLKNLELIADDIEDRGLQGKAVIHISFGCEWADDSTYAKSGAILLEDLVTLDAVIVCSTGNDRVSQSSQPMSKYVCKMLISNE